ncbi:hypothetical protein [Oceanobacillus massiliensis]|uniref:hypothetical protein n=1 Tax=Oceanobacillus massiliensis TaxID=1465765 RepID=UPI00028A2DA9|nr:hypothetical protein [Oceanobacillus massiliensis]
MKHTYSRIAGMVLLIMLLSGCLYPQSELEQNQIPNEQQLETVQQAVDSYKEEQQGLVPIKTKASDTPIFQKYLIDFSILKEKGYLAEIPGNAYEKGGVYQYTLLTPEDNPTVKLIDLRITEAIRSVNVQLDLYRNEHLYPAYGEKVTDGIYTVDYEKLGLEGPPTVVSPYSQESLPIIMDVDGNLYVDYSIDLNRALQEYEHDYAEGEDIRFILTDNTPFAPAYSLPYTIENGKPAFLKKNE